MPNRISGRLPNIPSVLNIDPSKALDEEKACNILKNPAFYYASTELLKDRELQEQVVELELLILETISGYDAAAAILALLDAMSCISANVLEVIERIKENRMQCHFTGLS